MRVQYFHLYAILQMKILTQVISSNIAHNYKDLTYSKNNITLIKPSLI